jgi:hypothetical protein
MFWIMIEVPSFEENLKPKSLVEKLNTSSYKFSSFIFIELYGHLI